MIWDTGEIPHTVHSKIQPDQNLINALQDHT